MFEDNVPLYAALEDQLRTGGLGRIADAVLGLARPALRLDLSRAEEATIPVGMSKVGGSADLPVGDEWPAWRGVPLPFIAQVQLEEVAALDPEGNLPHRGLLSFFYALNEPDGSLRVEDDPAAWRVLYTENTGWLARRPLPAVLAEGLDTSFPACAVSFSRRLTLPDPHSPVVEEAGFTDEERLGPYLDLVSRSDVGYLPEMDHRLLGYPQRTGTRSLSGWLPRAQRYRTTVHTARSGGTRARTARSGRSAGDCERFATSLGGILPQGLQEYNRRWACTGEIVLRRGRSAYVSCHRSSETYTGAA